MLAHDTYIHEVSSIMEYDSVKDEPDPRNEASNKGKFVFVNPDNTVTVLARTINGTIKQITVKRSQLKIIKKEDVTLAEVKPPDDADYQTPYKAQNQATEGKSIHFERKIVVLGDGIKTQIEEKYGKDRPESDKKGKFKQELKVNTCQTCNKTFMSYLKYEKHLATHSVKKHTCSFCGKVFKNIGSIQKHENIHKGVRYPCEMCNRELATKHQLEIHVRKHKGEYTHKCEECGKEYYNNKAYRQHMESEHKGIRYTCDICGSVLRSRRYWRDHMAKHTDTNIKRFFCQICNKFYSSKTALNGHLRIHAGDRYECTICGKKSTQKAAHVVHMRLHTGEKEFICEICGKDFVRKDMMQAHKRRVHEKFKYTCQYCKAQFKTEHHLLIHLHSHDEIEKNFPCEYCQEKFLDVNFLRNHVNRVHVENMPDKAANTTTRKRRRADQERVECKRCKKTYPKSYIRTHEKLHSFKFGDQKGAGGAKLRKPIGKNIFVCTCGVRLRNYAAYTDHINAEHAHETATDDDGDLGEVVEQYETFDNQDVIGLKEEVVCSDPEAYARSMAGCEQEEEDEDDDEMLACGEENEEDMEEDQIDSN